MQHSTLRRFAVLLFPVLLLAACDNDNRLTTDNTAFEQYVDQKQNLVFRFNKDIYPDTLLYKWDSTAYISFSPKVEGMYKWNSSSELVFSPSLGFAPATEYTAKFNKDLLTYSKKKYTLPEDVHFHTAELRVTSGNVSWTRGQNMGNVMVQLDLDFNYDVPAAEAAAKIKLSTANGSITTTTINNGTGRRVALQFMPVNEKDEEIPLKIEISKGIPIAGADKSSGRDTTLQAIIPSRYNLEVTNITSQHTGTEGIVTISTSQPVHEDGLKKLIKLEPSIPFDISTTESGFIISSEKFSINQQYQLKVSQKMEGEFGGRMRTDYEEQVIFKKLDPAINFTNSNGMYISSQGNRNLSMNIVNVSKVVVSITKVYENNLEQFFNRGTDYRYAWDEENDQSRYYQTYRTHNLGDVIYKEEFETSKLPKQNAVSVLNLNFKDKIKSYDGVYIINVASADHQWVQDSKILALSDIGLIVKEEKDNIYVFANSISKATPMEGVKISFISTNNQRLDGILTGSDGEAKLADISKNHPGFKVGMITAKKGDEFSFVWFDRSEVQTSRFDVGGRIPTEAGLNAMIYAERNLYRPGEKIHVSTIIRNEAWKTPGEIPVKLRLEMPNGKEFATNRKILNAEGACETTFETPPTAMTGTYTLEVYTGNDLLLNSYNISVEEFVPDRIKATLSLNKKEYDLGDSIKAIIQADNLFGTPATNRNYDMELNMNKKEFKAKQYEDYSFEIENDFNFDSEIKNGKTDSKGSAAASFMLKKDMKGVGMLEGNVMATVFDETGRPLHRYEHFTVYTQPVFIGIKDFDRYVSTRRPQKIYLVATDKKGTAQNNVKARVTLIKKEWHSVIEQDGNRYRYVSRKQEKVIERKTITISGTGSAYSFMPSLSGEYEVRISVDGSESYVSATFWAWGWGDTQYTSFEVNNEGNVTIKPDKEKYELGEDINLLFTAPFDGRMLVTVERDEVIKHLFLTTENKSASLKIKADEGLIPNVYITATLFRPMDNSEMPLTVAHGFRNIFVEDKQNHIPVTVTTAEKSRSKTKQTISVKTTPGAFVTIAAVDEGILQVKNYKTPDPYKYFYQKVALSTKSYDIYPLLLPEIKTRLSSTGGDGYDMASMRVNPMFVNRIKNVSFWSGIRQADNSGNVTFDIDIPQFSGDIRVMALAYKSKGFGSSDVHMKVADPIVISTALPRFFSPKDEVVVPVTISNTTGKKANATVEMKVDGPIEVQDNATHRIEIAANNEGRAVFAIKAREAIGAGKVTVTVKALNETFVNETEIGVRPAAGLQKSYASGQVKAGAEQAIDISTHFIPASAKGKLIVSKSPLVQFSKDISELIHYPYGCVEQTTSTAFPQLYYYDLVKDLTGSNDPDMNPGYNVRAAILKLQSMQLYNGALSYWPGGGSESWWGSVFATHFLVEAQKAGYQVNNSTVKKLLEYLKYKLKKKETITYFMESGRKEIAAKEIAYSLFVLALAGDPQYSSMNYYKAHSNTLSLDSKYMLAAAFAVSGQKAKAYEVLPKEFEGEKAKTVFGGSFYSYIRDKALALYSLVEINPEDPQVGTLARQISEHLNTERYLSTQERVFSILALGKIAQRANKTNASASVNINGKTIANTKGEDIELNLAQYLGNPCKIKVDGKGSYYYFVETSGITADGSYKEEDSYLKVRHTYFTREGREVTNNTFRQNDLVVVRITIETQYDGLVENVVITDMLPAGFEVENNRLNALPELKWVKDKSYPDYQDFRDDRVNIFTSVGKKREEYFYMVRAVSPGVFQLGPVQADAMYNGAYHSYHGAGTVKIVE